MSNVLVSYINSLVGQKKVQVVLRSMAGPIGPGVLQSVDAEAGLYRLLQVATMRASEHAPPIQVQLPVVFSAADVLTIIEEPLDMDGQPIATATPGESAGGRAKIWTPH